MHVPLLDLTQKNLIFIVLKACSDKWEIRICHISGEYPVSKGTVQGLQIECTMGLVKCIILIFFEIPEHAAILHAMAVYQCVTIASVTDVSRIHENAARHIGFFVKPVGKVVFVVHALDHRVIDARALHGQPADGVGIDAEQGQQVVVPEQMCRIFRSHGDFVRRRFITRGIVFRHRVCFRSIGHRHAPVLRRNLNRV